MSNRQARKARTNGPRLSRDDLLAHLIDQQKMLVARCSSYDAGDRHEAADLAARIRVLVHDTDSSRSVLGQLKVKDRMLYEDSAGPTQAEQIDTIPGLVAISTNVPRWGDYVALYERRPPGPKDLSPKPFPAWWNEAVMRDKHKGQFSRKRIVLAVANKEGGSHVDPALEADYAELTRNNSIGIERATGSDVHQLESPIPAAVRQIGHELSRTLQWWLAIELERIGVPASEAERVTEPIHRYAAPDTSGWTGPREQPPK